MRVRYRGALQRVETTEKFGTQAALPLLRAFDRSMLAFKFAAATFGDLIREQEPEFARAARQATPVPRSSRQSVTGHATIERHCHELAR
jgi:hypothetical protein